MTAVRFPGLGSGIDGVRIAQAAFDQATMANRVRSNQVADKTAQNSGLEELRALLLNLRDSVESMRSANGGPNARIARSSNTEVLDAVAEQTALSGNISVQVHALAKNATGSFGRSFSSQNEFIASSSAQTGLVTFAVGSGGDASSFSVNVTETMSAMQFVSEFNSQAGSKASASLVNLGTKSSPLYRIAFSSTASGVDAGSLSVNSANSELLNTSLQGVTLEAASNARVSVAGISAQIERPTNEIDDAISGVSLRLKSIGVSSVSVVTDSQKVTADLGGVLESFNQVVQYISREDKVVSREENGETVNDYGALARTSIDENIMADLRSIFAESRSADGKVSLASIGLSTGRDGTISLDRKKLEEAMTGDAAGVLEAVASLADKLGGVQGRIQSYVGFGNALDQEKKATEQQITGLTQTIGRAEENARQQQENIINQFSRLEGLMARMNNESAFISNLLKF